MAKIDKTMVMTAEATIKVHFKLPNLSILRRSNSFNFASNLVSNLVSKLFILFITSFISFSILRSIIFKNPFLLSLSILISAKFCFHSDVFICKISDF